MPTSNRSSSDEGAGGKTRADHRGGTGNRRRNRPFLCGGGSGTVSSLSVRPGGGGSAGRGVARDGHRSASVPRRPGEAGGAGRHVRCDRTGMGNTRRGGQQRRLGSRHGAAGGGHAGDLRKAHLGQHPRHALRVVAGDCADETQSIRRQHHQHRVGPAGDDGAGADALRDEQGGDSRAHRRTGAGGGRIRNPGQQHRPRLH